MSTTSSRRGGTPRPPAARTSLRWLAVLGCVAGVAALVLIGARTMQTEAPKQDGQDQIYGTIAADAPAATAIGAVPQREGEQVTVRGKIVDLGPAMGCWLIIDDGTGQVLIQTDPMLTIAQSVKGRTLTATGTTEFVDGGMGFTGRRLQVLTSGVRIANGTS